MARIPEFRPSGGGLSGPGPALQDPDVAGSKQDFKIKQIEFLQGIKDTLVAKRQQYEDSDYLLSNTTDAELLYSREAERISRERAGNPKGAAEDFQKFVRQDIGRRKKDARNREQAQRLENNLNGSLVRYSSRMLTWENNQTVQNIGLSLNESIEKNKVLALRSKGDFAELDLIQTRALESIDAQKDMLPPEVHARLRESALEGINSAGVTAAIHENPYAALNALKRGDFDERLDANQLQAAELDARREIKAREAEVERKETERREKVAEGLALQLYRGTLSESQLAAAHNGGQITTAKFIQIGESLKKKQKEQLEIAQRNRRLGMALDGSIPLDPKNKNDRKAVDEYYQRMMLDKPDMAPEVATMRLVQLSNNTGIVPDTAVGQLRANVMRGNPEQQEYAADVIERIAAHDSRLVAEFPDDVRARAKMITEYRRAGMDTARAVEVADNNLARKDDVELEARRTSFKGNKSRKIEAQQIAFNSDEFDPGFFSSEPDIPQAMVDEYDRLNEAYFVDFSMDAQSSSKMAYQTLRNRWAMTEVDGSKRMMKYAPEAVYGVQGVDNDWMHEQLVDDLAALPGAYAGDFEGRLYIEPHPSTLRQPDPGYSIFIKDEAGVLNPVRDKENRPLLWRPDWIKSKKYNELTEQAAQDNEETVKRAQEMRGIMDMQQFLRDRAVLNRARQQQ